MRNFRHQISLAILSETILLVEGHDISMCFQVHLQALRQIGQYCF